MHDTDFLLINDAWSTLGLCILPVCVGESLELNLIEFVEKI